MSPGHFVARVTLDPDAPTDGYPFDLGVVRWLRAHGGLALYPGVTFLVGRTVPASPRSSRRWRSRWG